MRYFALATDYDGTLATQGKVEEGVLETLAQLKASGRRLVMVTGRLLRRKGVDRVSVGRMIVATWEPYEGGRR